MTINQNPLEQTTLAAEIAIAQHQPEASDPRSTLATSHPFDPTRSRPDPLRVAHGVYITIHGHFYQPPRENPYLDAIERQPGAAPFHDWNERIHHECYRPNAFARVLNDRGEVIEIVNNFEYFSFNIGPTLMSWLERYDIETYQRILEADRKSCERLNGHGNAIAQVYNHIIMPLANPRDKLTQIRWGKADFHSRFGRAPEGMWLAETAIDYDTLAALVAEGIRFIVLAPSQAERCRPISTADHAPPEWQEVGGGQIDPTRPYRCYLREQGAESRGLEKGSDVTSPVPPYIDIFFYDGPISRDMGFEDAALSSSYQFASRLGQAVRGDRPSELIAVATDGETFGHHKGGTEKCLAYAFAHELPARGWTVTNFAHYLSLHSPEWEVELKPVTAWSCCHGVDRWQDDCGCGGGGEWHQKWRRPLREALDWLRDQLVKVYEEAGRKLFRDPWAARDAYIQVIRDRSPANITTFLSQHQTRRLNPAERVDALRLLEMQRHALLMYTSCGWFFEELSRPEGTQILRYAARALELAGDVTGIQLEKAFIRRLTHAPSNVECFRHGAEVYRQLVKPAQISLELVAAHYAISSLFTTYAAEQQIYCYTAHQLDYQLQRMGSLTLAIGQLQLVSEITRETANFMFAILHLGGWDFHCCIQTFLGRREYTAVKERLLDALQQASAAQVILAMNQVMGNRSYNLQNLFAEERHRIMRLLTQENLTRLDQLYTQVYRDNYGVLLAFHRDELPVPQELQVAAEVALSHRVMVSLRSLEQESSDLTTEAGQAGLVHLTELETIATEANHLRCQFDLLEGKQILERLILQALWHIVNNPNASTLAADVDRLQRIIDLGSRLHLNLSLSKAQELYLQRCSQLFSPSFANSLVQYPQKGADKNNPEIELPLSKLQNLLFGLGQRLAVDNSGLLETMAVSHPEGVFIK
jgi:alpha-amylase/alpha-mannosidase (GH57 family)